MTNEQKMTPYYSLTTVHDSISSNGQVIDELDNNSIALIVNNIAM
jgi:hypothetical protein